MRDGAWRRQRLASARLYLCTDRRAATGDLASFLDEVLAGGVDLIQLRDKDAAASDLRATAAVFRSAADTHDALFIVNDDPHLAVEAEADGVHVGQEDPPPATARATVGAERLIGRSTHSVEQIDRALTEDCDYFAVGPVHATPTKEGRPAIGMEPIRHAAAVADRPWYVTGGMAPDTAADVIWARAHGVVVVRALTGAENPKATAARLKRLLEGGREPPRGPESTSG